MAINLTLAQLKEYFKTWHENHFDDLHKVEMIKVINSYLDSKGLNVVNNNVDSIKSHIVKVIKILSQSIDGNTSLNDDSSISTAINEIKNKENTAKNNNLTALLSKINQNTNNINTLNSSKANLQYVQNEIQSIRRATGQTPAMLQEQEIPVQSEKNLNNYTTPGLYKSKTSAITNTLSNKPNLSSPFTLIVIRHADNGVRQILIAGDTSNNGNKIYMRNYVNGSWSSQWHELYGTHNTTPFQMQVEFANGSTQTYTLLQKL